MQDRKLLAIDEEEIMAKARVSAADCGNAFRVSTATEDGLVSSFGPSGAMSSLLRKE